MTVMNQAMQAAKEGRAEQLQVLEKYLAGETVEFVNHQGKGFEASYDPSQFERERAPRKLEMDVTAVILDAATNSDHQLVKELLEKGVSPNTHNADGLSALHQCCIENSIKTATVLINGGADVNCRDGDWWTPLHAAAACGHWRIVNYLLGQGADALLVNADGELPLDVADDEKTGQYLTAEVERLGMSEEDLEAARNKPERDFEAQLDEWLADPEFDVNKPDEQGIVPLHVTCANNFVDATSKLIEKGAKLDIQDPDGETPLHLAVFYQYYKIVELLGNAGANASIKNRHLETPIILSEDSTMIRLIRNMEQKKKIDAPAQSAPGMRDRSNTLGHRKTTLQKQEMAKLDIRAEFAKIEQQYKDEKNGSDKGSKDDNKNATSADGGSEVVEDGSSSKGDSKSRGESEADKADQHEAEKLRIAALHAQAVTKANDEIDHLGKKASTKSDGGGGGGSCCSLQ